MITASAPDIPENCLLTMKERHREIARRLVAGDRDVDISKEMGITQGRLWVIKNSPAFQQHLRTLSERADLAAQNVQGRIQQMAPVAMGIIEAVIKGEKIGQETPGMAVRLSTSEKLLDRAGYSPVQRSVSMQTTLTPEDIDEIKLRSARVVSSAPGAV